LRRSGKFTLRERLWHAVLKTFRLREAERFLGIRTLCPPCAGQHRAPNADGSQRFPADSMNSFHSPKPIHKADTLSEWNQFGADQDGALTSHPSRYLRRDKTLKAHARPSLNSQTAQQLARNAVRHLLVSARPPQSGQPNQPANPKKTENFAVLRSVTTAHAGTSQTQSFPTD